MELSPSAISLFALLLGSGTALGSAVWVIATIKGTTDRLGEKIEGLGSAITDLNRALIAHKDDLASLRDRVTKLEFER